MQVVYPYELFMYIIISNAKVVTAYYIHNQIVKSTCCRGQYGP